MMAMRRVLIFYLVGNSGHHAAARYLQRAFSRAAPDVDTRCVDLLNLTHPKLGNVIQRTYMTTVRRTPELWEALYDNFWIEHLTRRLRQMIQQGKSEALRKLMAEFAPNAVVATQAYPFAVMASFAARHMPDLPLFGVTTDFVPHRFWINHESPNEHYVVPTESAAARLMWLGAAPNRIHILGIPVANCPTDAAHTPGRTPGRRYVLVMGGGRGLGITYRTVARLDASPAEFTLDVVCGTNRRLRRSLVKHRHAFKHPMRVRGYVSNVNLLMRRSDLIVTKAGGVTLAEAAGAGLPMMLVNPLPGQEQGNTEVMMHGGAAVHIRNRQDVTRSVTTLLTNRQLLHGMRHRARAIGRPRAADAIVQLILETLAGRAGP
jgi:processive 1,2-diacylglycerol beta-glucosyltransferase